MTDQQTAKYKKEIGNLKDRIHELEDDLKTRIEVLTDERDQAKEDYTGLRLAVQAMYDSFRKGLPEIEWHLREMQKTSKEVSLYE